MFSAMERWGARLSSCCTTATPSRCASRGVRDATGLPSTRISPLSGLSVPDSRLMSVLLPAPFSQRRAWMRPAARSIETSRSTGLPKKAFERVRAPRTACRTPMVLRACSLTQTLFLLALGDQLVEQLGVVGRVDIAVGREVLGAGEVAVEIAFVDGRQRHVDVAWNVFALQRLHGGVDGKGREPIRL